MSKGPYANVRKIFRRYWNAYGGWPAVFTSAYLHVAVLASIPAYFFWSSTGWWDLPIGIVPNLLGFTLGGYALLVGFMGERFRKAISGPGRKADGEEATSPFLMMNATFVHYVLVQALALIFAVVSKACHGANGTTAGGELLVLLSQLLHISAPHLGIVAVCFWALSYVLFMYALTLTIAAVMSVFRIGVWLDTHDNNNEVDQTTHTEANTAEATAAAPEPPARNRVESLAHRSEPNDAARHEAELEAEQEAAAAMAARKSPPTKH